jgi:outer membrane lipoprotein-sorting protein
VALRRPSRSRLGGGGAIVLALGWVLTLPGCASLPPVAQPASPEAEAARGLLERRREEFRDLRTLADIQIRREDRMQRLAGVLLLSAPSSLRFEALSPFGSPVLVVVGDVTALTVWEVLDDRAYILPPSPSATRRWLGLSMGEDELVALLFGCVVLLKDALALELLPPDDMGPSLSLRGADGAQRIWFDPASGRARKVRFTGGAEPAEAVFVDGAAGEPPAGVTLRTADGKLEVSVRYRDPQVNTGFEPELFKLTIPERVRIRDFR